MRGSSRLGAIVLSACTLLLAVPPAVLAGGDHLLLSELAVTPTAGEMVEIHNPTASVIDLSDVYLTDATYFGGGAFYYNIVTNGAADAGGGTFYDFHARFPDGASIAAGEYQTVAIAGSDDFSSVHGVDPTYELYEDGVAADGIPDMREAFAGSIALPAGGQVSGFSNTGEVAILYYWDHVSDLVSDLDYVMWGDTAEAVDKTGVTIDSAFDGNPDTSSYLPDTVFTSQAIVSATAHTSTTSWHRVDLSEGTESASGGNGVSGNDETSENLGATWAERTPTPGEGAVAARELLFSELAHGGSTLGAEYLEIFNASSVEVELETVYLSDVGNAYTNLVTGDGSGGGSDGDFVARFPDGSVLGPGESISVAVNGSDAFTAAFGRAPDYELYEDGTADAVPDMVEATAGSINSQGALRAAGEALVLSFWNGASDLVTDLDYLVWGDKQGAVDKSGVTVDGPDADTNASAYAADTAVASQDSLPSLSGAQALLRADFAEGTETSSGGNGFDGEDESSENLSLTWYVGAAAPGNSGWVINEIHADPDLTLGDANGSGTVSTSDDEFVEIVNISGFDRDISGWTLADGYSVRHTFPDGTVVPADCSVVVFGAGPVIGIMGGAVLQEASSGGLGLNNTGDMVLLATADDVLVAGASYDETIAADNQSITLDPDLSGPSFVKHSLASGANGALYSPGTRIDGTPFAGCSAIPTIALIWDVQGAGVASPFQYQQVTTGGVVTARRADGFFLQDRVGDGDPMTSDGLWVQEDLGTSVQVGDEVIVTGQVVEYYGMTEIANPSAVTIGSAGQPLPAPVVLDASTPSTIPSSVRDLERFEGMLVQVENALVTGATNKWGDSALTLQPARAFVEPGVLYPGIDGHPEITVFDGNPEVFELAPYQLGLGFADLPVGAAVTATGGLQFSYGDYQLWPTSVVVADDTPASRPVRARRSGEILIGSQNLFRLFNTELNPEVDYTVRLGKIARLIVDVHRAPDVLAVQEVESFSALADVAAAVASYDPSVSYTPYLEIGNFPENINLGFLVRDTIGSPSTEQVGKTATFNYNYSDYDMFSRPPLVLRGSVNLLDGATPLSLDITVVAVHLRSRGSIESDEFVRVKRWHQAEWLASYLHALQLSEPNVVVVGDFNAFQFSDGLVDTLGIICGEPDAVFPALMPGSGSFDPNLSNRVNDMPAADRYSYTYLGSAEAIDHALVSQTLLPYAVEARYGRANTDVPDALKFLADSPLRAADHDGIVLYLSSNLIFTDDFELGDTARWSAAQP